MSVAPLSERMRPKNLNEFIGQAHLVGPNGIIRKVIENGMVPSIIFWGPPGVGKTTLAQIIANEVKQPFYTLSAINSGVKDIREIIEKAKNTQFFNTQRPILFIDEIHRFSKSQQDSLLSAVEKGVVTLIGATTENPSFEVIPALLSRCQVYTLESLGKEELLSLLTSVIENDVLLRNKKIFLKEYNALLSLSGGDARKLLNLLEITVNHFKEDDEILITDALVTEIAQQQLARYDKNGEMHYDIISAFIKSIRGSDPNAAVYWLARMVEGGEDPLFIARRMLILSSEDIGNANPTAFVIANNCFQAVSVVGWPESRIILSQTAIYLATSPKSNASYMAINTAQEQVKKTGHLPVPLHLRNAPTKLMKELGYGKEYQYSHLYKDNFSEQEYLPKTLSGTIFYEPGNNKREEEIKNNLRKLWQNKYKY
ncbi:MAG: replication-associated recombination protein A [Bacteroidetes bacterium]|nr:replication-associated recombination protein A [Bacteroidota bacterium]MBV6460122.1 Replication-associated recombination protein A [Flavobacteriales bacterium]WKZ73993.1 MAG: replication-associated recombination protein A [Vicingaceae bacterium]MCL4816472.1 replication-associated recombination protein A [Flavobacteriales bacterium]NOG95435.1 replication-associated recombination protein A [Bacteroidota bacterium]